MKKLLATLALVAALFGTTAVFAPSASATCAIEQKCREGAVLVYILSRLLF